MTKYATGYPASGALTGAETLQVVRAGADLQAPVSGFMPTSYIDGLILKWVSNTAVTVTSGSAYVPSLGYTLRATSDIAKTSLSLSASTMYHAYLFLNGSTPDVEFVTTAPSAPYNGIARTKTSDTTRRYLGSFITTSSGAVSPFTATGSFMCMWTANRVVNNGMNTAVTTVSVSSVVPASCSSIFLRCQNNSTANSALINWPENISAGSSSYVAIGAGRDLSIYVPVPSLQITYNYSGAPATSGTFLDVLGYNFER